jgi:hypothetical protein
VATKILIHGFDSSTERRVQEDPETVSRKINGALQQQMKFVILTDADSGKEFSVEPEKVGNIEAE